MDKEASLLSWPLHDAHSNCQAIRMFSSGTRTRPPADFFVAERGTETVSHYHQAERISIITDRSCLFHNPNPDTEGFYHREFREMAVAEYLFTVIH